MLILGIDPGTRHLGWGAVELVGNRYRFVACGTISTKAGHLAQRLKTIATELDAIIAQHAPTVVAVETIFNYRNSRSALTLAHARGVALLCGARGNAEIVDYTPASIKRAIAGNGQADKTLVQRMVRMMLGVPLDAKGLDATDALAVALCHGQMRSSKLGQQITQAMAGTP